MGPTIHDIHHWCWQQMRMDPARPDLSKFDAIVGSVMLDAQQAVLAAQREAADRAVAGAA